jgi:hypothetical protein
VALAEARPRTTRHELLADRRLNFPRRKREVETSEEQVYGIWDMGYRRGMRIKIKEGQKMGDGRSEMGYRSEMKIKIKVKEISKAESGMVNSSGRKGRPTPA